VRIGVPKEIKADEHRVALTAAGVRELVERGHEVLVESEAGVGSAIDDDEYSREGATIVDADGAWAEADLVLKVKEPVGPSTGVSARDSSCLRTCIWRRTPR
jgi:alanine dehydrogenase